MFNDTDSDFFAPYLAAFNEKWAQKDVAGAADALIYALFQAARIMLRRASIAVPTDKAGIENDIQLLNMHIKAVTDTATTLDEDAAKNAKFAVDILNVIYSAKVAMSGFLGNPEDRQSQANINVVFGFLMGHMFAYTQFDFNGTLAALNVGANSVASVNEWRRKGGGHNRKWINIAKPYREQYPSLSRTALAEKILGDHPDGNKGRVMASIKPLFPDKGSDRA